MGDPGIYMQFSLFPQFVFISPFTNNVGHIQFPIDPSVFHRVHLSANQFLHPHIQSIVEAISPFYLVVTPFSPQMHAGSYMAKTVVHLSSLLYAVYSLWLVRSTRITPSSECHYWSCGSSKNPVSYTLSLNECFCSVW